MGTGGKKPSRKNPKIPTHKITRCPVCDRRFLRDAYQQFERLSCWSECSNMILNSRWKIGDIFITTNPYRPETIYIVEALRVSVVGRIKSILYGLRKLDQREFARLVRMSKVYGQVKQIKTAAGLETGADLTSLQWLSEADLLEGGSQVIVVGWQMF